MERFRPYQKNAAIQPLANYVPPEFRDLYELVNAAIGTGEPTFEEYVRCYELCYYMPKDILTEHLYMAGAFAQRQTDAINERK